MIKEHKNCKKMREGYLRLSDIVDPETDYRIEGNHDLVIRLDSIMDCYCRSEEDCDGDVIIYYLVLKIIDNPSNCYLLKPKNDLDGFMSDKVVTRNKEKTRDIDIAAVSFEVVDDGPELDEFYMKQFKIFYDKIREKQFEFFGLDYNEDNWWW